MRLEAIWILTNICCTTDTNILFRLLTQTSLVDQEKSLAELLNSMLIELSGEGATDIKTFASIMHWLGNLLSLEEYLSHSQDILWAVVGETCLIDCITEFITKNKVMD